MNPKKAISQNESSVKMLFLGNFFINYKFIFQKVSLLRKIYHFLLKKCLFYKFVALTCDFDLSEAFGRTDSKSGFKFEKLLKFGLFGKIPIVRIS